jgi:hypothetical protein
MKCIHNLLLLCSISLLGPSIQAQSGAKKAYQGWPQAAGPNSTWQVYGPAATNSWSVSRNQHILWRTTLPNGGQSGIAVWHDRIFLTTFDTYKDGDSKFSGDILGHCVDAKTGKILWSVKLHGPTPSPMLYSYSDATSPSPSEIVYPNESVMA